MKNGGELTYDEMVQACKNVGVDLACGACAAVFYTGIGGGEHTCKGSSLKEQIERARKDGQEVGLRFAALRTQCALKGHEEIVVNCYGPICGTCSEHLGWPCSTSSTGRCMYSEPGWSCMYCGKNKFRGIDPKNWT